MTRIVTTTYRYKRPPKNPRFSRVRDQVCAAGQKPPK
jgi:hypothetical protein